MKHSLLLEYIVHYYFFFPPSEKKNMLWVEAVPGCPSNCKEQKKTFWWVLRKIFPPTPLLIKLKSNLLSQNKIE